MSWIDISTLVIIVLVGLFGLWRGIAKGGVSLMAFAISFLLAFFLANVIAEALLGVDSIKQFVFGSGDPNVPGSLLSWVAQSVPVREELTGSFIDVNFYTPMYNVVEAAAGDVPSQLGVELLGAYVVFAAICAVGIFFAARILLIIVTVVVKSYIINKPGALGRLGGFLLGAVRGALYAFMFTLVFSCVGGYTKTEGIAAIEGEYENNAVVCGYLNEGAYYLKNKMFLADKETYGRLAASVYKKTTDIEPEEKTPTGNRLKLLITVGNFAYTDTPYAITEDGLKYSYTEEKAIERSTEFANTGFDTVSAKLIEYFKGLAETIKNMEMLVDPEINVDENFATLNSKALLIKPKLDDLWTLFRDYETHYTAKREEGDTTTRNSELVSDHSKIKMKYNEIMSDFALFATNGLDAFPSPKEINLPEPKKLSDVQA